MADNRGVGSERDRDEVATYVAELTNELAKVARRHGLDALGYLLEMVRMEAENVTQRPKPTRSKAKTVG